MNAKWIDLKLSEFRLRHFQNMRFCAEFKLALRPTMDRVLPILFKRVTENRRWWLESVRGGKFPEGMGEVK